MSVPIHIVASKSAPSLRWTEAFPFGQTLNWPVGDGAVIKAAEKPVLWVHVGGPWQDVVRWGLGGGRSVPTVVVSSDPQDLEALSVLQAGARGYCHAFAVRTLLRDVQDTVAAGGLWVGAELMSRMMSITKSWLTQATEHPARDRLSVREAQVVEGVLEGLTNKEIARRLNITERTVKAHLGASFEKLGVRDRLQLALMFRAVPPPPQQEVQ
ncbi:MAG: hypothetical protein OHK0048_08640 [Rhodoferax sp.]